MFIYAFDEETKKELINKGFEYVNEFSSNNITVSVFQFDKKVYKLFDKNKIKVGNKLFF